MDPLSVGGGVGMQPVGRPCVAYGKDGRIFVGKIEKSQTVELVCFRNRINFANRAASGSLSAREESCSAGRPKNAPPSPIGPGRSKNEPGESAF